MIIHLAFHRYSIYLYYTEFELSLFPNESVGPYFFLFLLQQFNLSMSDKLGLDGRQCSPAVVYISVGQMIHNPVGFPDQSQGARCYFLPVNDDGVRKPSQLVISASNSWHYSIKAIYYHCIFGNVFLYVLNVLFPPCIGVQGDMISPSLFTLPLFCPVAPPQIDC